ncbi:MAG: zinc-binding dehydrogenase [Lachnospiraceae bacterium]|nr:zinc-binding dehydrogenase [Lachnospiraceae bacterium]
MLNTIYQLVAPRRFEVIYGNIGLNSKDVLVRPTHLSICNADQRYYQGLREASVLQKKLPMALIHEAIGEVIRDPSGEFKPGEIVVMIPNTPTEEDEFIAENYRRSSKFRASGFDGFMQEYVNIRKDRLVRLPEGIDQTVAAFTEIVSVSVHAIGRFDAIAHKRRNTVGIWGDGNLGYITAVFFKTMFPDTELYIFGINRDKLSDFTFADGIYTVDRIPEDLKLDHAFECVGGAGSGKAIEQIIDVIQPEGTISILGVSEYPVPVNTRMVLEKGLRIFGSSRSGRADFEKTVEIYRKNPEIINYLSNIVGTVVTIRTIDDMKKAFELDIQKAFGKTIMIWEK